MLQFIIIFIKREKFTSKFRSQFKPLFVHSNKSMNVHKL